MFKGIAPTHIDHPGTPLQLLILLIIWLSNLGLSTADILNKVLTNPELYLFFVSNILIILSFLTSVLLSAYIYYKTNNKIAAVLTQLPGLSFLTLKSFTSPYFILPIVINVSPEPFLISIVNLFSLSFLMLYFSKKPYEEFLATLGLGLVCGLGLATKLTFFPLLFSALIIIPWRLKPLFIMTCSISFVLSTFPIISKYPLLFQWIINILTHAGFYGMGAQEFINWNMFFVHLFKDILSEYWFYLYPVAGIFIYSSIALIKNFSNRNYRFLWVSTFGVLFQVILLAKHFSLHYIGPGLGLCGCVFFLFYINNIAQHKILKQITTILVIVFIFYSVSQAYIYRSNLANLTQEILTFHNRVYSKYPHCTIIASQSDAVSLNLNQEYALFFGNRYSSHMESEELLRLYPQSFYFNPDNIDSNTTDGYGIWNSKSRIMADDILSSNPCVIFLSGTKFKPPYEMLQVDSSNIANAYIFVGTTEKQANELFALAMEALGKGEYQRAFALAIKSRELNYQPKNKVDYFLTLIYKNLQRK